MSDLPNTVPEALHIPDSSRLTGPRSTHPPRILLLCGSLRRISYSRMLTHEAARLLQHFGAETRIYDPAGLPLPDDSPVRPSQGAGLRELSIWSEGQVWTSPERHGAMTGVMKSQIDWIPLATGSIRPTQGKTLAVMQVSGGRSPSTPSIRCACSADGCG